MLMSDINHALLKVAREAKGWTQTDLATRVAINQGTISKYEKALDRPGEKHLGAIAEALGVPVAFFFDTDARPAAVLYRSRALRSAKLEAHVRARLNVARLIAQRLLDDIGVETTATFPDPDTDLGDPEQAAEALRAVWWVPPGPIDDISDLIERAGGVVLRVDLGTDDVVAAYMHPLGDPTRWFFVNTRVTAGDRVRFSLAHELGHAVMHEAMVLPDTREAEKQSHSFAGAFLLPRPELRRALPRARLELRHLLDLKREWGVSMQTIALRAREIGAISQAELTRLYKQISYRGWRQTEPGTIDVERPTIFDAALTVHRRDHGLNDAQLAQVSKVTEPMLASLFPESFAAPSPSHLRVVSARPFGGDARQDA